MLFIVRLTDRADRLALGQQHVADHRKWLAANAAYIRVTGALRHDGDSQPCGALWIVEAESKAFVEELITGDLIWIQGLRESREVWHRSSGFPENKISL